MNKARRSIPVLLQDMLDCAGKAMVLVEGMDWGQYAADEKTQLTWVLCFEVIGEATAKIPRDFQVQYT